MSDIEHEARDLFVVLSNADGQMAERIMSGDAFTWEVHEIVQAINRNRLEERAKITAWLRSLDHGSGDINRFLPTTLANWIDERMHEL